MYATPDNNLPARGSQKSWSLASTPTALASARPTGRQRLQPTRSIHPDSARRHKGGLHSHRQRCSLFIDSNTNTNTHSRPCSSASASASTCTCTCTAAPTGSTGYSQVFKGCDAANVATYYAKDECVKDNATNLCGSGAWRLPTKDELLGIVKTTEAPTIDNLWFTNTPLYSAYWTSSPYPGYAYYAWFVDFDLGYANNVFRGYYVGAVAYCDCLLVRLVR